MTLTLLCCLLLALTASVASARGSTSTPHASARVERAKPNVRAYARKLILARWNSEAEWRAADQIIRPESNWNPCAYYPSQSDCRYTGRRSCGIPQANPCPREWLGRMWETRYAQVRWFVAYVARRYGSPSRALSFRLRHGWY